MKWACFAVCVQASWRRTVSTGVQHGIPMPCFTTALSFYDGYRHEKLPANLLQVRQQATEHSQSAAEHQISLVPVSRECGCSAFQAQRDYFGAHTYELLSNPGKFIHTNWTGHGGNVSSSSYNAWGPRHHDVDHRDRGATRWPIKYCHKYLCHPPQLP